MHRRPVFHRNDTFRRRSTVTQRTVRPDRIVVNAPLFDQDLGFSQGVEQLAVEQRVAEPGIEAPETYDLLCQPAIRRR